MQLIEISELPSGAHNNQTINGADPATFPVPEGWAIIHESDGPHKNFPFGSFETEIVDGRTYMKLNSWTPGKMPEPEPKPEPEPLEPSVWDELQAAYEEGVNSVD